jgi:membrane fusion protein, multidrug efflux system
MIKKLTALHSLVVLTLMLGWAACNKSDTKKVSSTPPPDDRVAVRTVPVVQRGASPTVTAAGVLTSDGEQRLSFKIGGIVRKIFVAEGQDVKAGQLLAVLDKTEIDASVAQAQQGLQKAERDLERVNALYRDSSATLELLQNATTARDVAKELVRVAQFNQQYAEIRATRSGRIIKKIMNEGEIIGPGMPVLVLFAANATDWVVRCNVSDRDWASLRIGQVAELTFDAFPNETIAGKVSELAPAADPGNGLYTIEISVTPQGRRFAPGLFAQATIRSSGNGQAQLATLPIEAIVEGDGRAAFVYAVQPDGASVRKVPVTIAYLDGRQVFIANGLQGVNQVVTAGAPYLTEQKKVQIVQ